MILCGHWEHDIRKTLALHRTTKTMSLRGWSNCRAWAGFRDMVRRLEDPPRFPLLHFLGRPENTE